MLTVAVGNGFHAADAAEVADHGRRLAPQWAVVDDRAAALQQQHLVERLHTTRTYMKLLAHARQPRSGQFEGLPTLTMPGGVQ